MRIPRRISLFLALALLGAFATLNAQSNDAATSRLRALPAHFEPIPAAATHAAGFVARPAGYSIVVTGSEAVAFLPAQRRSAATTPRSLDGREEATAAAAPREFSIVRMQFAAGKPGAIVVPCDVLPATSNYFFGNDPKQWRTDVPHYGSVSIEEIYPGIDIVYRADPRDLEYDLVIKPGADPSQIRLRIVGADAIALDSGDLVIHTPAGDLRQHAPAIYQEFGSLRQRRAGGYRRLSADEFGFELGPYDPSRELVIDPVLSYSTYLGGSGEDEGFGIAIDASRNAWVTGRTTSMNFPPGSPAESGGDDVFVAKFSATGTLLVSTFLGGSGYDIGRAIAVDTNGNAYVAGYTASAAFPVTNGVRQATYGGGADAFVTKISASGSTLLYSTFLGGARYDEARAIAVDSTGNAYIAGQTQSTDFPTATPIQAANGGAVDVFIAKLNATASALVYSTYAGGSNEENVRAISVDSSGNAVVTGLTASTNYPVVAAFQSTNKSTQVMPQTAFLTKVNAAGSSFVFSTYLGGTGADAGEGVFANTTNIFVAGQTSSTDFPVKNPTQANLAGASDAFVSVFDANATLLVYSTYLGGADGTSGIWGLALDGAMRIIVAGGTSATQFPKIAPAQPSCSSNGDAFITRIASPGVIDYSTCIGGANQDIAYAVAADPSGAAYVTGTVDASVGGTPDFPMADPYQATFGGGGKDAFVLKLLGKPGITSISPSSGSTAGGTNVTISGNALSGATVTFAGASATITSASDSMLIVTTPPHAAGAVSVVVTTPGGSATATFNYVNPPVAPTSVVALAVSGNVVSFSFTAPPAADSYRIYRSSGGGVYTAVSTVPASGPVTDTTAQPNHSYLYRLRTVLSGVESADSNSDYATTVMFTNDPLGNVVITGAQLLEMRTAVNAMQALAARPQTVWIDPAPVGQAVKAVHITELRGALNDALLTLGFPRLVFSNALTPGASIVKAADFQEIRNGTK